MRIEVSPYQLTLKKISHQAKRDGALIRIVDDKENFGVADLMPWPELGDDTLKSYLAQWKADRDAALLDPLLRTIIENANRDWDDRKSGRNRFQGLPHLQNNLLMSKMDMQMDSFIETFGQMPPQTHVKVKISEDYQEEIFKLNQLPWVKQKNFRFDLNSRFRFFEAKLVLDWINGNFRGHVQYIEDPCPYHYSEWNELSKIFPLAIDWQSLAWDPNESAAFQVFILKPARQSYRHWSKILADKKIPFTITSNMDHSVGILTASAYAAEAGQQLPEFCLTPGCDTVDLYASDPNMNPQLESKGGWIQYPNGIGLGFHDWLKDLDWEPLLEV